MAGAAVGIVRKAAGNGLHGSPVKIRTALHIVNPQVFYPHPCLGAEHAGQIARGDMALRASDGFALCVLGVRGEHQFILIHAHFVTGQAKLRP